MMMSSSSSSTLSTGLNKSESFIKRNAIDIHTRELTFINNQKVYIDEDTEIPRGGNIRCYLCFSTFGYFENYRICHKQLSIWLHLNDDTIKTTTVLPSDVDSNGLLPELTKQLSTIGVHLLYNKQINGYQGFMLSFRDYATILRIELNYYFAWMMSIVFKYDLGKGSSDKKVIFDSGVQPNMDLIGLVGDGGSRNRICTKMIYPLSNGGINRITVSSDFTIHQWA